MIETIEKGMKYQRYTEDGEKVGKYFVVQKLTGEFVTRSHSTDKNGLVEYFDVQRRTQNYTIVAITVRHTNNTDGNKNYRDVWYKLDIVPGHGYWTTNPHRVTRYMP